MILEKFNDFPCVINFDPKNGIGQILDRAPEKTRGMADIVEDMVIALYVENGSLILQIGQKVFDLSKRALSLSYQHTEGNETIFSMTENNAEIFTLRYASWWRRKTPLVPPGFGKPDDDEEDFLSYIKLMYETENRKLHLIRTLQD